MNGAKAFILSKSEAMEAAEACDDVLGRFDESDIDETPRLRTLEAARDILAGEVIVIEALDAAQAKPSALERLEVWKAKGAEELHRHYEVQGERAECRCVCHEWGDAWHKRWEGKGKTPELAIDAALKAAEAAT